MKTFEQAYRVGRRYLQKRGVESASFIAELLLRSVMGWDRTRLFSRFRDPMEPKIIHCYVHQIVQRAKGVPVQYLLGEQEFYGRVFQVGPSVLIPRPETEVLIETVLRETQRIWKDSPITVVDAGTGSGAIAVTLAAERPLWQLVAVDCSSEALVTARKNGEQHGTNDRIRWLEGNWLTPLKESGVKMDVLVSNPPYIPTQVIDTLDTQVKKYEPILALDGGKDGLDPYRILVKQLPQYMNRPGLVAFEVGEGQSQKVKEILENQLENTDVDIVSDLAGRSRIVIARIH
ncbi:peptide chain release factor N(5)-glutamine methyltransferase [Melghirimyces algeriensis]|uniref:Release factor glutamine methyltransferase n=1 Tax=Melghirimyces algeriensis TaxID=910412 RepID=A0A521D789_9BACL|nr:peptide chain release factor N(5)-glutamine methyltransferase [Melghirimyces algeriensis]SMO67568.1 release factor glutamine methyltransferase [Melghirimyces algeriensis]